MNLKLEWSVAKMCAPLPRQVTRFPVRRAWYWPLSVGDADDCCRLSHCCEGFEAKRYGG